MILSFSVSNYRSIRDKVNLSMLPAKSIKELPENVFTIAEKINLLRSVVIYGANASGKTNILKGFTEFIAFIKNSSDNKLSESVQIYDPFLLDKTSEKQASEFEIEFLSNEIRFVYSVSCFENNIAFESLFYYPKGQKVLVFERNENKPIKFGSVLKGEKKSIEARLLPNQLFLSKAANENLDFLVQIYTYLSGIENGFSTMIGTFQNASPGVIVGSLLKETDSNFLLRFQEIITSLDVGIQSVNIREKQNLNPFFGMLPKEASEFLNNDFLQNEIPEMNYEVVAVHSVFDNETKTSEYKEFPLEMESSGTRNLFLLAMLLLDAFDNGTVMIIDEFEKSLHPQIVRALVQLFHNPKINTNNAQLIFTTHDISLLNNELFRRDQIWFTEKDEFGKTDLYALSQIDGVRKDAPYDKWYMSGRFGATPIVQEPLIGYGNAVQKGK